jgi:RNA polymerase sigma-32 factor
MSGRYVSLSASIDDESTTRLEDLQKNTSPAPDEELSRLEEIDHLKTAIEKIKPELSEREKIILEERLLNDEPLTLQEIGEKHGITREAVRQMEVRLIKKIKERFTD